MSIKKSATLREQAVEVLLRELGSGSFTPGQRLTELGLAERLNVSRTPIREALNQLVEQGLLHARPQGGYVVPRPTVEEIRQIIAVRMLLEPAAARIAASEYGEAEVEKINQAIASEDRAATVVHATAFAHANEGFRQAMFGAISNKRLRELIAQFANHLKFIRGVTLGNIKLRHEIVDRQRKIRDAIVAHDSDLAEGLWKSYLRFAEDALVSAMEEFARARGSPDAAASPRKSAPTACMVKPSARPPRRARAAR